jgi:hypothetical protein
MIAVVEGPPGSGKSFSSTRRIVTALEQGKYVATNIEMEAGGPTWDDWARAAAKSNAVRRCIPGRVRSSTEWYRRSVFVSGDLDRLMRVRLPPCKRCSACKRGSACRKESRGVMVLDEAHNWLNARNWQGQDRDRIVKWFTQHRKLGWDVFLITQRGNNIDVQVRALAEYRILLRNLRRVKVWGVPILPFNLFLALWTWEGGTGDLVKREAYLLNKRVAGMYDTMATSHGLEDDEFEPIWLPLAPAEEGIGRPFPQPDDGGDRPLDDAVSSDPTLDPDRPWWDEDEVPDPAAQR